LRSFSLRKRLVGVGTLVLVVALGLVGLALNAANQRGAVSALQARMESYVYLVLAATELDAEGRLEVEEDFADRRLSQPGSGIYVALEGRERRWRSRSALGQQLPAPAPVAAGQSVFEEPSAAGGYYTLRYGVGWQVDESRLGPLTVTVQFDPGEIEQ
jgi:two-component system sensor histidine kinase PhoQ